MSRIAHATLVASLVLLVTACGQSSSSGDDGGPETRTKAPAAPAEEAPADRPSSDERPSTPTNRPAAERDSTPAESGESNARDADAELTARCAQEWEKLLASQTVGLVKAYERHAVTRSTGERETKRFWRETVTEVTDESFTLQRVDRALAPTPTEERESERTTTREATIEDCKLAALEESDDKVEILETHEESLTVKAGTFETAYVKTRQTGKDETREYEYLSEVWTLKERPDVAVKAKSLWKTTLNDAPFEEESVIELVELVLPGEEVGDEAPQ